MEYVLPIFAALASSALVVAICAWTVSAARNRKLVEKAKEWLPTEGTVISGALEGSRETGKRVLPTFAFSYRVSGEYYSGRFALYPDSQGFFASLGRETRRERIALKESMVTGLIGRKVLVRYNPLEPAQWFIADERIDGCKVEQKIGLHVMRDYYPSD